MSYNEELQHQATLKTIAPVVKSLLELSDYDIRAAVIMATMKRMARNPYLPVEDLYESFMAAISVLGAATAEISDGDRETEVFNLANDLSNRIRADAVKKYNVIARDRASDSLIKVIAGSLILDHIRQATGGSGR